MFKRYYSNHHFRNFYLQDGAENQLASIRNEMTSLSPYMFGPMWNEMGQMVSSNSVPHVRIFLPHIWCLCGPHIFIICRIKLTCRLSKCSDFNRFKQYYTDDSTRDIFNIQRIACRQTAYSLSSFSYPSFPRTAAK